MTASAMFPRPDVLTYMTYVYPCTGVPGLLAALSLAYCSNLFGSITHYGSGQGAVYYGAGYVSLKEVFSMGALMAVVNLAIWAVVGGAWWKVLGFY